MRLSPLVAEAAVPPKAVVLLLLMCCLMCFPLVMGTLRLSLFCCALLCVFVVLQSSKRGRVCFPFIALRMSCYCICSVNLPHGAVGWSAVCDCGIS